MADEWQADPADQPQPQDSSGAPSGPIPYATPRARTNPGYIPVKGRIAIGCLGYIGLSILYFVGLRYFLPAFERQWTINGLPAETGVVGWAAMTVVLLGIAIWLRVKFGYKGYGYGILSAFAAAALLVVGLVLLLLAICASRGK